MSCTSKITSNYYIKFDNSNKKDFFSINQYLVSFDETQGNISIPLPIIDSTKQGKQFVKFSLSDPTFDNFILTFTQGDGGKNDETAKLSQVEFGRLSTSRISTFEISSLIASGFQIFKINNPNTCYKLDYQTLTVNVNTENVDFPFEYNLVDYLTFENSDICNKLPKNSIRIKFFLNTCPSIPILRTCLFLQKFSRRFRFIKRA